MASLNCHSPLARILKAAGPDEASLALDTLGHLLRVDAALAKAGGVTGTGMGFATAFAECGGELHGFDLTDTVYLFRNAQYTEESLAASLDQ